MQTRTTGLGVPPNFLGEKRNYTLTGAYAFKKRDMSMHARRHQILIRIDLRNQFASYL